MKLVGLYIDGYGILHDFTLTREDLLPSPCVIYGLNEAGKSTLLSFIRSVLFGFKSEGNVKSPVRGGLMGGYLLLEDGGEVFRVERYGRGNGTVAVELPDGSRTGEEMLQGRIIKGTSPVLYKNVFAFGMDEMRMLETLGNKEIGNHIYGAGTGTGPQRLTEAVKILEKTSSDLYKPRGRAPVLNKMLNEMEDLDGRIRDLEQQPARYLELQGALKELEKEQRRLKAERSERQKRIRRLDTLLQARAPWHELQACLAKKDSEEPVGDFPGDGLDRLSRLEAKEEEKRLEVLEWTNKVKAWEKKLASISIDQHVLAKASLIRELEEERSLYLEKKQKVAELNVRVEEKKKVLQEKLTALGTGWHEEEILKKDTSLSVRQMVADFDRRFRGQEQTIISAHNRVESIRKGVEEREAECNEIKRQIELLTAAPQTSAHPPEKRLEMLDQAAIELEKTDKNLALKQIQNTKLSEINDRCRRIEAKLQGLSSIRKSYWPVFAALFLVLLGCGVLLIDTTLGLLIIGVGVGLALFFNSILAGQTKERRSREAELQEELATLNEARVAVQEELSLWEFKHVAAAKKLREIAFALTGKEALSRGEIPSLRRELLEELEGGRQRHELLNRLRMVEQALARAQRELQRALEKLTGEQENELKLQKEWRDWLDREDLPDINPSSAMDFIAMVERMADDIKRLQGEIKERDRIDDIVTAYERRAIKLAGELAQREITDPEISGYVLNLAQYLNEQQMAQADYERYSNELEEVRERRKMAEENLAATDRQLRELLNTGGAADSEDFRRRAALHQEQQALEITIEALHKQLAHIAMSDKELEELQSELWQTGRTEHEVEWQELEVSLSDIEERITNIVDKIATIRQQMHILENGDELARYRQQRDMLKESFLSKSREWKTAVICAELLNMAREKHERERQPAVLARASSFMSPMTEDRYARAIAPVGATEMLEVEELGGRRVPATNLSRGAAGQLYLAIRLALACHFSSVVTPMPIILDDILVDFDARRLKGTLRILEQIARDHQVIFFTCHDYILEACREDLSGFSLVSIDNGLKVV